MKPIVDINDEFDVAVLNFIKTVYYQSKYDKRKMRNLFHPDVIEAVMRVTDETERDLNNRT
ncbi:hypothetical protein [Gallibacterium anatis]|uniref:hypothetical protein n=1 Tax=Gallibacterium anatis TaxID=750 RepID=UPI00266EEAB4|nr:hypothetical protein [Gallibacterium anatis]WKS98352.1 hypothetical protein NYR19_06175 [Gallibacterium anatis]